MFSPRHWRGLDLLLGPSSGVGNSSGVFAADGILRFFSGSETNEVRGAFGGAGTRRELHFSLHHFTLHCSPDGPRRAALNRGKQA